MTTHRVSTTTSGFSNVGRVFLSIPFIVFGLMHFMNAGAMSGLVPGWLPGGVIWVYLTGAANLAAGLGVAFNRYVKPAAVGLMGLLSLYILAVHVPGLFGEGSFQMAMQGLLKDVGLLGGAILVYTTYR